MSELILWVIIIYLVVENLYNRRRSKLAGKGLMQAGQEMEKLQNQLFDARSELDMLQRRVYDTDDY